MGTGEGRRIVIVTGAGVSAEFGADGEPLPLMSGWSEQLRAALNAATSGLADVLGLTSGLDGDEFEARLGAFLAFKSDALPALRQFRDLFLDPMPFPSSQPDLDRQIAMAESRTHTALEVIRSNLFDSFGHKRIDLSRARTAYEALRGRFGDPDGSTFFTFATTNYDPSCERAFASMDYDVRQGFRGDGFGSDVLDPINLSEQLLQSTGIVGVLHLHGAVGWYRDDDGLIRRHPSDLPYNATLGTPALLLPDPTKSIGALEGAQHVLWQEFERVLDNATHVAVLGHSLHDRHLVEVIDRHASRLPLAVFWHSPDGDLRDGVTYVRSILPTASVIPGTFGPRPEFGAGTDEWLSS